MFSITTMASSTTKPTDIVSAMSEILSRLNLNRYIIANVPAKASGTVTQAMNVVDTRRRNKKQTITTRAMLMRREAWTSATDARIVTVRSLWISRWIAGGNHRCNWGRMALMRSTVSMTFASACLRTNITTARLELNQPA